MNKLRLAIRDEVTSKWVKLGDSLKDDIEEFADKLFEKNIITKGARKNKDLKALMDNFTDPWPFLIL